MRIALFDPSLRMLEGHFTDLDLRLAGLMAGAGHRVKVHARADAPASLDRLFAAAAIDFGKPFPVPPAAWFAKGFDEEDRIRRIAAAGAAVIDRLEPFDLAVWPSASAAHAMGYALSASKAPAAFGIFEHPMATSGSSPAALAEAQSLLAARGITTSWGFYVEDFIPLWRTILAPGTAAKFPYPTVGLPCGARRQEGPLRIGLLGAQRDERRIDLTIPLARAMLAEDHAVVLQDSSHSVPDFTHERMTRHGFLADLSEVFAACDLVVWPAIARNYMGRPSGLVAEAISCGIPLVMSAGCYPSQMAGELGSAMFFQKNAIADIMATLARAISGIAALRQRAAEKAIVWNRTNGIARLAETFLDLAR